MRKSLGFLFFIWVLASTTASSQNLFSDPSLSNKITQLFADYTGTPGAAVGVFYKGQIWYKHGYGLANLDYDIPITSESVFEIASLSKQFTAACILALEDEGKLKLTDPIQKYFPEMQTYEGEAITINHLLHHTSGLRDYLKLMYLAGIPWDANFNDEDALQILQKQKQLNFQPGTRYQYSNSGYLLLALIVKKVSGMPMSEYARERLFAPLSMSNTLVYDNKAQTIKNRVIGYALNAEGRYVRSHYSNFVAPGDGGIYTTIEDFFKWDQNLIHNNVGIKDFSARMLLNGQLEDGTALPYAKGLIHASYRTVPTLVHSGLWAGFNSMYVSFPAFELSILVLSNNTSLPSWQKLYQIADLLFDEGLLQASQGEAVETPATPIGTVALSRKELQSFEGYYFNPINGYSRQLYVRNDTLRYKRAEGNESVLIPVSKHAFMMEGARDVTISFDRQEESVHMYFNSPGEIPVGSYRYQPHVYQPQELNRFEGKYRSKEQGLTYIVSQQAGALNVSLEGKHIATVSVVMKNIFNEDHFGYLQFMESPNGQITGFSVNDDSVRDIQFVKEF